MPHRCLISALSLLLFAMPALAQPAPPAPPPITKPSFDCAKVKARALLIVCGDDALARLDLQEDALYRRATAKAEQADAVRAEQDEWISERNGCGSAACLAQAYRARIVDLRRWTN
jgi:uncharacterized protein